MPKSPERLGYWQAKLTGNVVRDQKNETKLRDMGWQVLVIWECETKDLDRLAERIVAFLG